MTVAAFMDLALYDPSSATTPAPPNDPGRAGDFFTSVDVGPLFGELLEEPDRRDGATLLRASASTPRCPESSGFDLVEAAAGNGRLSADILRAMRAPRSGRSTIASAFTSSKPAPPRAPRSARRSATSPIGSRPRLSALPRSVRRRPDRERAARRHARAPGRDARRRAARGVRGRGSRTDALATVEGPPSTPALQAYLDAARRRRSNPAGASEINLRASSGFATPPRRLARGFIILIDYGHEARELYSATHSGGTLTTFSRHTMRRAPRRGRTAVRPPWLQRPGEQDITAHVDFTSVRAAAEADGLTTIAFVDQTYFLMGILNSQPRGCPSLVRQVRPRVPRFAGLESSGSLGPGTARERGQPESEHGTQDTPDARRPGQHAQGAHPGERRGKAGAEGPLVRRKDYMKIPPRPGRMAVKGCRADRPRHHDRVRSGHARRGSSRSGRGTRRSPGPASSSSPTRWSGAHVVTLGSERRRANSPRSRSRPFRYGSFSSSTTASSTTGTTSGCRPMSRSGCSATRGRSPRYGRPYLRRRN